MKAYADGNLFIVQMMIHVLDRVENMVGKGENAGEQDFLLFKQFFYTIKEKFPPLNSLPNDKMLDTIKLKEVTDEKSNVAKMAISLFDGVENTVEKRRKCWWPAFSPFPTVFSKACSFRVD